MELSPARLAPALVRLRELIVQGTPIDDALSIVRVESSAGLHSEPDVHLRWIVVNPGPLGTLPDAKCLSTHLPRDRSPTREEVERAIFACSRTQP